MRSWESEKPRVSSLPPYSHRGLQILFKDLFRFLLVYVLFMIGYASGEPRGPRWAWRGWYWGWSSRHGVWRRISSVCRVLIVCLALS